MTLRVTHSDEGQRVNRSGRVGKTRDTGRKQLWLVPILIIQLTNYTPNYSYTNYTPKAHNHCTTSVIQHVRKNSKNIKVRLTTVRNKRGKIKENKRGPRDLKMTKSRLVNNPSVTFILIATLFILKQQIILKQQKAQGVFNANGIV